MQQISIECRPYAKHTIQFSCIILVSERTTIIALVKHISSVVESENKTLLSYSMQHSSLDISQS